MEDREVLLKALIGSHNYNLNTEESDKDYKVFALPTFEDLYKGESYSNQIIGEEADYTIHDIRKLPELFFKANLNYLEVLFSRDIEMDWDSDLGGFLYAYRRDLFNMNLPRLFNACGGTHLQKMKILGKGTEGTQHLVNKYGYDTKQAQHAFRMLDFIIRYEETGFTDVEYALSYSGRRKDFMMSIREGIYTQSQFEEFIKVYHDENFVPLKEKYHNQTVDLELKDQLDKVIMNTVKCHLLKSD